jgi:hypothetical protein
MPVPALRLGNSENLRKRLGSLRRDQTTPKTDSNPCFDPRVSEFLFAKFLAALRLEPHTERAISNERADELKCLPRGSSHFAIDTCSVGHRTHKM